MPRRTHYNWMENDESYARAFDVARLIAGDVLEDEAVRRAHQGIDKPVTIAGEREIIREYSDTMLIFLLKGMKPDKYRERWTGEITGKNGAPLLPLSVVDQLLSDDAG